MKTSRFLVHFAAASLCSLAPLPAQSVWSPGDGLWSNSLKWSSGGVPASNGTANVILPSPTGSDYTITIDDLWALNGRLSGITVSDLPDPPYTGNIILTTQDHVSIDPGDITYERPRGDLVLNANTSLSGERTWSVASGGRIVLAPRTISGTGNLIKTGAGTLVYGSSLSRDWSGTLALYQGTLQVNDGGLPLLNDRVLSVDNAASSSLLLNTFTTLKNHIEFNSDVVFHQSGNQSFNLVLSGTVSGSLTISGEWSSKDAEPLQSSIVLNASNPDPLGLRMPVHLTSDNRNLLSSRSTDAFYIRAVFVHLENEHALGLDNALPVMIGQNGSLTADFSAGLLTRDGMDVAAPIRVASNWRSSDATPTQHTTLGLSGSGMATFSGAITLEGRSNVNQEVYGRPAILHLTAEAGGRARFTGAINPVNPAHERQVASILIEGGGEIELTGDNTQSATTTVKAGTWLLANNATGSATGSGAVEIESGAFLAGNGTLAPSGGHLVTLRSGATLSPGDRLMDGGIGQITLGSELLPATLLLEANTTLSFGLAGLANHDAVILHGNLTLAGSGPIFWSVTDAGTVETGNYALFSYTGTAPSPEDFARFELLLPEYWQGELFHNTSEGIVGLHLHAIPEPSAVALLLLPFAALGWRKLFRERQS